MNARRLLAFLSSYVFHPVLLLGISAFVEARETSSGKLWLIGGTFLLVPLLLLLLLSRLGMISSYHLPKRSERDLVYSLQLLWFGLALACLSHWMLVPPGALNRVLLAVIGVGILSLANRFVNKASAHMAVVTALSGIYCRSWGIEFVFFGLVALGLVWFARTSLKAHTELELVTGICCGIMSALFWIWLV